MRTLRGALLLLGLLVVATACGGADERKPTAPRDKGPWVVALLLDNTMLRFSVRGEALTKRRLASAADDLGPGRYLALGDEGQLFVLLRRSDAATDEVAVVDGTTLAVRDRYSLAPAIRYRGIVLAPSGVLYAYGNRPRALLDEASGAHAEDAVVTALDPRDGPVLATTTVRRAAGRDWWVYWGAVSTDESALVLTYHGGCGPGFFEACTTGADRLAISGEGLRRCRSRSRDTGCLSAIHGRVAAHGDGFLAATGTSKVLELDEAGAVVRSLEASVGGHLMQIAASESHLYAVGSCDQPAGLSALDLATEAVHAWPDFCGEALSAGPGGRVALAANVGPVPLAAPSRVVVVDASTGRVVRAVRADVEVLDLAFVP